MSADTDIKERRPLRWLKRLVWLIFVAVFLILVAGVLAWVFRTHIAEAYLAHYCDQRGLACEADVQRLGLNEAELSSLIVRADGHEALTAEAIQATYSWPERFRFQPGPIQVQAPVLRAKFDGTQLDLGGLETLLSGEGGGEPVSVNITSGRIILETPAGELNGSVDISGKLPQSGEASIKFDPANLRSGEDRLVWSSGSSELTIADGRVTGTANLKIEEAVLGTLDVREANFAAVLAGSDVAPLLRWDGTATAIGYAGRKLSGIETEGYVELSRLPDGGLTSAFQSLLKVTAKVSADSVNLGGVSSKRMTFSTELTRHPEYISGPLTFSAESVSTLSGIADSAGATGVLQLYAEDLGILDYRGAGVLEGAAVHAPRRNNWLAEVRLPAPFVAHGEELRSALDTALSRFDSGADFEFKRRGARWDLSASRPTALRAASGMTVSVEPDVSPQWLRLNNDGLTLSGEIVTSGGGGPTFRALLSSAIMKPGSLSVNATRLRVDPWQENDRTLSVSLAPFSLESSAGRLKLEAIGDVTIGGRFPGVQVKSTTLSGGFQASRGGEGWRVQTNSGACLDLVTDGLSSGALALKRVAMAICPEDGRFVREQDGKPTGKLTLGDVTLPFEAQGSHGNFVFANSAVNWELSETLRTVISADSLSMPMNIGARSFTVDGADPRVTLLSGDGPLKFMVSLGESDFGGTLIPASVSSNGFSFSGVSTQTGIEGLIRSSELQIEDYRADPIYQPLRADLSAHLQNGQIDMTGPLRLQRSGRTIADASMTLSLEDLNGTAKLTGRPLTFTANGFQPYQLSDRLRSVLPNARGSVTGNADFAITRGSLSGTGDVRVEDLSFDTFRLGSVMGVNGKIKFSDIIRLTTLPDQIVTIGTIDPGVRLEKGRLAFQLIGGRILQLEGARWPFAGGELTISPTSWQIGGKTELITINAEKIGLGPLVEALSLEQEIAASGTVSGTFPIEIDGANAYIRGALLKAEESGGRLAYLGSALDAAKGQSEYSDYALEALQDFQFKVLEVGADGNISGDIEISIGLEGSNKAVLDGNPFRFNMSIDSKLAQLIRSFKDSRRSDYIATIIRDQLYTKEPEDSGE